MYKKNIIEKWSNIENKENFIYKLSEYYSEKNNLDLINLNILEKKFDSKYWFICKKTSEIYYFNIIIDNKNNKQNNISQILSILNRYIYINININLSKKKKKYSKEIKSIDNTLYLKNLNNKRCLESTNIHIKEKKIKLSHNNIWNEMVSASSVKNYMLNDPLIDYLKEYNINSLDDKPSKRPNSISTISMSSHSNISITDSFTQYIMNAGIEFEEALIKILKKNHKIVKVADGIHSRKKEKYKETISLMKKGIPIIYQGVLHNYNNNTYGLPDLLIRSDYINKLLNYNVISNEEANLPSPKLKIKFHYKVVDIKHSNINLKADGIHILNTNSIPAYKGQIYIYTEALNNILGIKINKGFIWGKKYDYKINNKKIEINNFLNKLGTIDYDNIDIEYKTFTNNAIEWIRIVRKEGHLWTLLPEPSRQELYPNMKNEKDGHYRILKNKLNNEINEITNIWNCGISKRYNAFTNNIYKWTNPLCTSNLLGFNNKSHIGKTIDAILNINRQDIDIIRPNKILYDRCNWDNIDNNYFEFYLDFETLNSNFGSIINDNKIPYNNNQFIFLIGIGYYQNNKWIFKSLIINKRTLFDEQLNFDKFYAYVNYILKINNKKFAKFYHWSNAEPSSYLNFKNKNKNNINDKNYIFYDLCKIFTSEPIVIKDVLNFSLKSIAKSLYKKNLINSCWDKNSPCSNGLNAMILANKIYDKELLVENIHDEPIIKEIIYYNEIDCKVMLEIHNLLKNKF